MHPVFLLTAGYFAIGAAAIRIINRRATDDERSQRWTKFSAYLLIVHGVILAILSGTASFTALAAVVVAVGFYELLGVAPGSAAAPRTLAAALPLYAALAFAFLRFASGASARTILFVYVVVLTFDGFSEITGRMLGRHRLAPQTSPGKTWEGLAGGLATALATALPLAPWSGLGRGKALALGLLVSTSALAGDLAASRVKRACKVKDYGTWIPGHGGVLDRFDSFIAAGGVYWAVIGP